MKRPKAPSPRRPETAFEEKKLKKAAAAPMNMPEADDIEPLPSRRAQKKQAKAVKPKAPKENSAAPTRSHAKGLPKKPATKNSMEKPVTQSSAKTKADRPQPSAPRLVSSRPASSSPSSTPTEKPKTMPRNESKETPPVATQQEFITDYDLYLLQEGTHARAYEKMGAHPVEKGVHFAVWAPNASRVSVIGNFNQWDGNRNLLTPRGSSGIWTGIVEGIREGELYKYELLDSNGHLLPLKSDPYAFYAEQPPATASVVSRLPEAPAQRMKHQTRRDPVSIYEVHLASWRRAEDNRVLTYRELAEQLVPYAQDMGFTHLEFMPVSEHPFSGSWGYQPIGLFAPTSRFGTPEDFRFLVDKAHEAGLKVLLDWVPGHFPNDAHGLAWFDGTALYNHEDPRQGKHMDWDTLIYNYGRTEVVNFLLANALYWCDRFGVDGLRVDAVASMIYLNYSRQEGQWVANKHGGVENLEATAFLRRMNELLYGQLPDAMTVAEESTAWPGVSQPTSAGGLGFGFKWNMGWMHDTLNYIQNDPIYRKYHHHQLTFGLLYAFSENFILPISHDEVVHGKGSLLARMPGDEWQKFANLRAYLGFMWAHPGKKLLFMGCEFGQGREWNHDQSLDWHELDHWGHRGTQSLVRDLNRLYKDIPALHQRDCEAEGFEWLESDAADAGVICFMRKGEQENEIVIAVSNFTPVLHESYRIPAPRAGFYQEALNTDAEFYGGGNRGNLGGLETTNEPWHGRPCSLIATLPPLSTVFFRYVKD